MHLPGWMSVNCCTAMRHEPLFYTRLLDHYLKTGEFLETGSTEPLYAYLRTVMENPVIKVQVMSDEVCARVFYDTLSQFIQQNLNREKYNFQRKQSEEKSRQLITQWTHDRKRDGWQALVEELDSKYGNYGFNAPFYRQAFGRDGKADDDMLWEKLAEDWEEAIQLQLEEARENEIENLRESLERRISSNLKNIPTYIEKNRIEKDEFMQAWGMMNGLWNTSDFERIRKIVRIQKDFPQITEVANVMGRIANDDGKERIRLTEGDADRLEHASRCDIAGITISNDLNSLLPIEIAYCSDCELERIFIDKYLTRKLQTFRYQSENTQPARRLQTRPAQRKGPMIVCLDTSGSMTGMPERVAHSTLIKLLEIADRQKRDCFLIAFSVSIQPIDVRKERANLLSFFSRTACGDTDAGRMMQKTFELLQTGTNYLNADVLWISDFRIPLSSDSLLHQLQEARQHGTRFYGLQTGIAENEWQPYFDRIWRIGYNSPRRY